MGLKSEKQICEFVKTHLNGGAVSGITSLSGGLLNQVCRVETDQGSMIYKHAPSYIASNPSVPLDVSRIKIEAHCLKLLPGLKFDDGCKYAVKTPRLYAFNPESCELLMEDAGEVPDLEMRLASGNGDPGQIGKALGNFIARLHGKETLELMQGLENRPIRKTRFQIQYSQISTYLKNAGRRDWKHCGERCRLLGTKMMDGGPVWIMGDLWPRSVLCGKNKLTIIDWEMADAGFPGQDVGHLLAHLWMNCEFASLHTQRIDAFRKGFLEGYKPRKNWGKQDFSDCMIHYGAEIIARCAGAFKATSDYGNLPMDSPSVRRAIQEAENAISGSKKSDLHGILESFQLTYSGE